MTTEQLQAEMAYHASLKPFTCLLNDGVAIYPEKAAETYRIHTVVKGDTLWDIAKKYLGDGSRYPEIKALNNLKSNVIYSSWKLKIPN